MISMNTNQFGRICFPHEWLNDKDVLWNMFEMLHPITAHFHHLQNKRLIADRPENNEIASPFTNIAYSMNFWLPFTDSCNAVNEYDNWISNTLFHSESCTRSFSYCLQSLSAPYNRIWSLHPKEALQCMPQEEFNTGPLSS